MRPCIFHLILSPIQHTQVAPRRWRNNPYPPSDPALMHLSLASSHSESGHHPESASARNVRRSHCMAHYKIMNQKMSTGTHSYHEDTRKTQWRKGYIISICPASLRRRKLEIQYIEIWGQQIYERERERRRARRQLSLCEEKMRIIILHDAKDMREWSE